jgi:hypothetical protein
MVSVSACPDHFSITSTEVSWRAVAAGLNSDPVVVEGKVREIQSRGDCSRVPLPVRNGVIRGNLRCILSALLQVAHVDDL